MSAVKKAVALNECVCLKYQKCIHTKLQAQKNSASKCFSPLILYPAGLCSLATVCCYLAGMDLLHRVSMLPDKVDGSLGWSLYLALISSPLHMMAAALLVWAARSHSQNYYRMTAYRVA